MIFLCEFVVHDGTSISTLYVGTHGVRSGPNDVPANQYYMPRLSQVGRIERAMFGQSDGVSGGTTGGQSEVGFGNISVLNGTPYGESELIDHWKDFAFRSVTVKSLIHHTQPFGQAVTRFVGTIEQLVSSNALEHFDLIIHDRLQDFDKPLLIHAYAGTTVAGVGSVGGGGETGGGGGGGGPTEPIVFAVTTTSTSGLGSFVEGDVDLTDQIKQKIWGTVHNVAAIAVNHFDLVWQVSDGSVTSIVVYDGGVALTYAGDTGTLETLFATNIALGSYITCNSLGLFRLGSPAIGAVTADVVEGTTAAARTAGQITSRMVAWFQAMYPNIAVALDAADVATLDTINAAECGILVTQTETALAAITRVLNSIGAWMLPQSNSTSIFNLGRLDPPSGAAVASYDFDDNLGGNPERIESGDESKGIPAWKVIVRYDQIAEVQRSGDLFGIVTENDPVRVQYLSQEWRQASVENAAVLTMWPNAPTITVDTCLVTQAAAQAEAARLFALYSARRDIWKMTVPMADDPQDDPGIGEVIELTSRSERMGLGRELGEGELYRVLGRVDDFDDVPRLVLTVWGTSTVEFVADVARVVTVYLGTLSANEAGDTASITASIPLPVTGTFAATEAADTASLTGTVAATVISGLVLHYEFENTSVTDSSGNSNTGTIAGSGTTVVTGQIGNALSFNGSGYVTFTSISPFTLASASSEISVSCWIKTSLTDTVILSVRNSGNASPALDFVLGYNFVDNAFTGKPSVLVRDDAGGGTTAISATSAVNNNAWHHVVWTRNSSKLNTFYIDGVAAGSGSDTMSSGVTPNVAGSAIANERVNALTMFTGLMDDFQVYNRALTSGEVGQIYADGI